MIAAQPDLLDPEGATTAAETDRDLLDELRGVELLRDLPDGRLRRLVETSRLVQLRPGDVHRAQGSPADAVFVLLDGEVRVTKRMGEREVVLATYGPRSLFGELPVLMGMDTYFAAGRALTECRVLEVPRDAFWELVTACPELTAAVMREMARRIQELEGISQQRARLVSLGTLAAGLAHELNNPASAARRATSELTQAVAELKHRSIVVGRLLDDEMLAAVCAFYDEAAHDAAAATGALARMDAEEACAEWLEARGVDGAWSLAPALVDAGIGPERLERLAALAPAEMLDDLLRWLEVRARAAVLSRTAAEAAARVAEVVASVRSYTLLGQADITDVDVHDGLESTLAVLRPRLGAVVVELERAPELPPVRAYGGALNQVWTALVENAADALGAAGGHLRIRTLRDGGHLCVEVEDDGPGISREALGRVFDPFYTTKDVGEGTGMGLTNAYRIVAEHGGTLTVQSRPGRTVFQVRLPYDSPLPSG